MKGASDRFGSTGRKLAMQIFSSDAASVLRSFKSRAGVRDNQVAVLLDSHNASRAEALPYPGIRERKIPQELRRAPDDRATRNQPLLHKSVKDPVRLSGLLDADQNLIRSQTCLASRDPIYYTSDIVMRCPLHR